MSFIVKLLDQHSATYHIKLESPALKENEECRAEDEATRRFAGGGAGSTHKRQDK
jgi:hypothetical protein